MKSPTLGLLLTTIVLGTQVPQTTLAAPIKPEVTCAVASKIVHTALADHLLYRNLNKELVTRTMHSFVEKLVRYKGLLTHEEIELIQAELKVADKMVVGSGMLTGRCDFFELETSVLERAYWRLRGSFQGVPGLSAELAAHVNGGTALKPGQFAADTVSLRNSVLDALSEQVAAWEKQVDRLSAVEFVAREYLGSLDEIGRDLKTMAYVQLLKSFTLALDPHSVYHAPDGAQGFMNSIMGDSFTGVGVSVANGAHPYGAIIEGTTPGSPASASGKLMAGDVLTAVDGVSVVGLPPRKLSAYIGGPEGTRVTLTVAQIKNRKLTNIRQVQLTRSKIQHAASQIKVTRKAIAAKQIVTVRLDTFYRGSADDLKAAILKEKAKAKIDAMVLDLRDNPGGSVEDAVEIAGLFIVKGPVVGIRSSSGPAIEYDYDPSIEYDGPLVVAVNNGSASASEIIAGTLKDLERALVVGGPHTYGKGTVQAVENRVDKVPVGLLVFTTGQFYTAGGYSTQLDGVSSQIVVPGPSHPAKKEERNQKYALPASIAEPIYGLDDLFNAKGTSVRDALPKLSAASNARMAKAGDPKKMKSSDQLTEIEKIAADFAALK